MPRHLFRRMTNRLQPAVDRITSHPWVQRYVPRLADPDLWHLNRRSASRAVAVGLFCGLIPGPLQVFGSILLCLAWRANFPVAAVTTLYTNPFTIVPLYVLAYEYGSLFVRDAAPMATLPTMAFTTSISAWLDFTVQLGKPLAVGIVLLATTLATVGFVAVRIGWRCHAVWCWRRRARLRAAA